MPKLRGRDKLFYLLDEGLVDPKELASQLIRWITSDEANEFIDANGYDEFFEEDEDEEDED